MIKPKCKNCKYLYQEEENYSVCRRFPPQVVATGTALEMVEHSYFPRILSPKFEWCGEYQEGND